MPKSSFEVIVLMEGDSGLPKCLQERKIQVGKVIGVVPTTRPLMIKSDDKKKNGQSLYLYCEYKNKDKKKCTSLGALCYLYIWLSFLALGGIQWQYQCHSCNASEWFEREDSVSPQRLCYLLLMCNGILFLVA